MPSRGRASPPAHGWAQAATRLMQSLLNTHNLAGHCVALVLRLVARVPRVPAYDLV